MAKKTPQERFWAKVDKRPGDDGCWLWTGAVMKSLGYGVFSVKGKQTLAHRWSAALAGTHFGGREAIQHACPNRLCVRPDHLRLRPTSRERFWAKVSKREGEDACWLWTGSVNKAGYGSFGYEGKTYLAHRLAAAWAGVPVVGWLCIRHSCRLPRCVRPSHLFNATKAEVRASFRIVPEDVAEYRVPGAVYIRSVDQQGEVRRRWIAPHDIPQAKIDMARFDKIQKKIAARLKAGRKKVRRCVVCKVEMPGANNTRQYCGNKCRQRRYWRAPLKCAHCGGEYPYVPGEHSPKYCSKACRSEVTGQQTRSRLARYGGSLRERRPERLAYCCICGELFAHINSRPRICCGKACGAVKSGRVKRARKDGLPPPVFPVTRFCHTCHKGFACNALDPVTTCSTVCKQAQIV
jgi:hypothetical protein